MASRPSQAASVLFYFSVVLVAASSVAFGLDWMKAPLPPMPETEASVQAAKLAAHVPPPRKIVIAKKTPRSVYPTRTGQQRQGTGPALAASDATARQPQAGALTTPGIAAPEPAAQQPQATEAQQPQCDIATCSAAYRSFRASDCTWQPYDGPRRLCTRGNPPQQQAALEQADTSQYSDKCDIEACRHAYFTFDPTDCTYQPSNGPRRLCTKGTPPKPATAAAPADAQPTQQAAAPVVSDKCDVEACKRAYKTFNPADCTYKPTLYGPRALCTKGTPPKSVANAEPAAPAPAAATPPPGEQAKQEPPPPAAPPPAAPPPAAPPPNADAKPADTQAKPEAPAVASAPATATPPAAAPADQQAKQEVPAAPPAAATPPTAAAAPVVSDKCDVEACKRAYKTFNPADCTFKPTLYGPRALCTKGTPPKSVTSAEPAAPAAATPPASERAKQEPPPPAAPPPNANAAPADTQAKPEAPAVANAPAATTPPTVAPADEQAKQEPAAPPTAAPAPNANAAPADTQAKPEAPTVASAPATATPPAAAPADQQAKQEVPAAPPAAATPPAAVAAPAVSDKCDVEACKRAYKTFNPADCTYKPTLYGPRQLCTKGTPPKPAAKNEPPATPAPAGEQAKQEPAAASPSATSAPNTNVAPADTQAKPEAPAVANAPATTTPPAAAPATPADKCDVEACKRAYFSFNAADCTYQPTSGPRRLCTKHSSADSQAAAPRPHKRRRAPFFLLPPGLIPSGR